MTPETPRAVASAATAPHYQGEPLIGDVDLASRWVGGSVLLASDESFGEKENLLNPEPAAFEPGHYGNRGEIVDGWETRRRREPGFDWALIRLGTPGIIHSVDVDTSFFTGNFPESCRVEACGREGYPSPQELLSGDVEWDELVPRTTLRGDTHNVFPVGRDRRYTHIRLSAFPDGGIARLRVLGRVVPDPRRFDGLTIDLASQEHGGVVVTSSDGFYTSAGLLNRPDRARTMGEGWETRRRRDDGHDHVAFRLALAGVARQLIVDTAHFKYNASAAVALFGADADALPATDSPRWEPLLPKTRLQPDTRHVFEVNPPAGRVSFVRLDAFPDGGLSRVRIIGSIDLAARQQAGLRFLNTLPAVQVTECLTGAGVDAVAADRVGASRPVPERWREHLERLVPLLDSRVFETIAGIIEGPDARVSR
jgi:allantoicase